MPWSIQWRNCKYLDAMSAGQYSPGETMHTKVKIAITCLVFKEQGKIQLTKRTTQEDKQRPNLGRRLLIKTLQQRKQIFYIFKLFITKNKRAPHFGTYTPWHRHATCTARKPTLDPSPSIGILVLRSTLWSSQAVNAGSLAQMSLVKRDASR